MSDTFPVRLITDKAGYIRHADANAAALLNLSARALRDRPLLPFLIDARAEFARALQFVPYDGHPLRAVTIRPREKRQIRVLVQLRDYSEGVEWLISRGEPLTAIRGPKPEGLNVPAVLVIDPVENTREQYRELISAGGYPAIAAESCEGTYRILEHVRFSAAVVDVRARTVTGESACHDMRRVLGPLAAVIGVTREASAVPPEIQGEVDALLQAVEVPTRLLTLLGGAVKTSAITAPPPLSHPPSPGLQ